MEAGETLDHTARREAEEETGVRISGEHQKFCGLVHQHVPATAQIGLPPCPSPSRGWACRTTPSRTSTKVCSGCRWRNPRRTATPTPPPSCSPTARHTGLFPMAGWRWFPDRRRSGNTP
ncbi:NUDIX domain-containing protein [Streptomyces sp. NPDC052192]|uniref:NUDIX domain-containing protein n=1 Tax=Streptomyces sp. NPDC052192 TaxID=3155052 RepID=UPI003448DDC6